MTKNIFIITGEASGDNLGAGLMHALKTQDPSLSFTGIGGDKMIAAGIDSLIPMEDIAVMGIWEVLWQLPRLLKIVNAIVAEIEDRQPDVVITIDAQEFSLHVAQRLKKNGTFKGKLVHYVAPTVWAWRPGRAKQIAATYDLLLCLFPFEPKYFKPLGLKTEFVGHPLIEHDIKDIDGHEFRQKSDIKPDSPVLGLFLGSREREIKTMIKPFAEAIDILQEQIPDLQIITPTTKAREYDVIDALRTHNIDAQVMAQPDWKWQAFAACDLALAVSGTVGLELAYMGVPHVIGYKTDLLTFAVIRALVKVKYAHLANILLNKEAVPELLQFNCTAPKLATALLRLHKDEDTRMRQLEDLKTLRDSLTPEDGISPSEKAASTVLDIL
jgi:lipid-A-disaccharide synthase